MRDEAMALAGRRRSSGMRTTSTSRAICAIAFRFPTPSSTPARSWRVRSTRRGKRPSSRLRWTARRSAVSVWSPARTSSVSPPRSAIGSASRSGAGASSPRPRPCDRACLRPPEPAAPVRPGFRRERRLDPRPREGRVPSRRPDQGRRREVRQGLRPAPVCAGQPRLARPGVREGREGERLSRQPLVLKPFLPPSDRTRVRL